MCQRICKHKTRRENWIIINHCENLAQFRQKMELVNSDSLRMFAHSWRYWSFAYEFLLLSLCGAEANQICYASSIHYTCQTPLLNKKKKKNVSCVVCKVNMRTQMYSLCMECLINANELTITALALAIKRPNTVTRDVRLRTDTQDTCYSAHNTAIAF